MDEATSGATGAPVVPGAQPPVGNPASAPAAGAGGQAGQGQDPSTTSGQEPDAKGFREELKATKARNKALEAELDALRTANLTAAEKQAKQLADRERTILERETALQERSTRLALQEQARRLGFRNPEVAARLLDREQLTFNEDGTPENADTLLKALLKSEPYLASSFSAAGIDQGARDGGGTGLSMDDIKKMSQAEVMARYDEVMAAMGAKT